MNTFLHILWLVLTFVLLFICMYIFHNSENKHLLLIVKIIGIVLAVFAAYFVISFIYTIIISLINYGDLTLVSKYFETNLFAKLHLFV